MAEASDLDTSRADRLTEAEFLGITARRKFRWTAVLVACVVIVFLCSALAVLIYPLSAPSITGPTVGLVASFIAAIVVLSIALLRSAFSSEATTPSPNEVPLPPTAELAKSAIEKIVEQVTKP